MHVDVGNILTNLTIIIPAEGALEFYYVHCIQQYRKKGAQLRKSSEWLNNSQNGVNFHK